MDIFFLKENVVKNKMQKLFLLVLMVLITVFQGKLFAEEEKNKTTTKVVDAPQLDLKKNLNEENNNQVKVKIEEANKLGSSTPIKKNVELDIEKKSLKDKKMLEKKSQEQVTALETKKELANENSSDKKTNQKSVKTNPM